MQPFTIYNASAGSGKTFTLVKEYLKIILGSPYPDHFKSVLAITFTNKAVNEMKERILMNLKSFSTIKEGVPGNTMFDAVANDLKISDTELSSRATRALNKILHHYALFDIVTIDKFNHRLLRTFAHDLKLPINFEVVLDTALLLQEATDMLLFQAGEDALLTKVLLDFALEKADDDKSWDIGRDLFNMSKLLLNENHTQPLTQLQNISLEDFHSTGETLRKQIRENELRIKNEAKKALECIENRQIPFNSFTRGSLPNFFKKLAEGTLQVSFGLKWQENIAGEPLYPKKTDLDTAAQIESIQPELAHYFETVKALFYKIRFLRNLTGNLTPLSLLNTIQQHLQIIKNERNLLMISEFNQLISNEIALQPAPFIYERIGEKYRHYFIDEFQDTSALQWQNLVPLIGNALESETLSGQRGTLMLVGDAKQAIYRWRGGEAEQFINLYQCHNPFQVEEKTVLNLPKNFRSCREIIEFNNRFFRHIAPLLTEPSYKDLFLNSHQDINNRENGYVHFDFIEKNQVADEAIAYCEKVVAHIRRSVEEGWQYSDICILTRRKKEGSILASYLTEHHIPVVSSESLLVYKDPGVHFLINILQWCTQPQNKEITFSLLLYLSQNNEVPVHTCIQEYLNNPVKLFETYSFSPDAFRQLPLFEAFEYAVFCFVLGESSNAHIHYFMDEVLEFSVRAGSYSEDFLSYWEKKKENLSIVSPQDSNAVKIMTIHKSKGLEFPIVIYPFANTRIKDEIDARLWLPVHDETLNLPAALFSKNKDLAEYHEDYKKSIQTYEAQQELDQYNLLYVALTRAVSQLYIVSDYSVNNKGEETTNTFSGLFINYLKITPVWNDSQRSFHFGEKPLPKKPASAPTAEVLTFSSKNPLNPVFKTITKGGALWETSLETAREKGNLYHLLLSRVQYHNELDDMLEEAEKEGIIANERPSLFETLSKVIYREELAPYFSQPYTIYNEHDIYTASGDVLRPDRIAIDNRGNATILDYKTGKFSDTYTHQLQMYEAALTEMGYCVKNKILVFIGPEIEVQYV
ncbi:UvrD-helicase domain-containing protein [Ascidiimonas aurantiaca]|uniref:UvrD-helicase domain-containing protein n=1 Tax=Ascidiimonas aurantiaca TaxID=1685432 RepID=UPI0030EC7B93